MRTTAKQEITTIEELDNLVIQLSCYLPHDPVVLPKYYVVITTPLQVKVNASGQEVSSAIMKGKVNTDKHVQVFTHAAILGIAYSQYHLN